MTTDKPAKPSKTSNKDVKISMKKLFIKEVNDELINRGFNKVTSTQWKLQHDAALIQIDLVSGSIRADWNCQKARDLTFFDLSETNNTYENNLSLQNTLLWIDRYRSI